MISKQETDNLSLRSSILHSKLSLLGLSQQLLRPKLSYRILPTDYFAVPTKPPGEQFDIFRQICKWLFVKCNKKQCAVAISKIQDPFAFSQKLGEQLNELQIDLGDDVSLHRVKAGYGLEVLMVLEALVNFCLRGFDFKSPQFPEDSDVAEQEGVGDEEIEEEEGLAEAVEDAQAEDLLNMIKSNIRHGSRVMMRGNRKQAQSGAMSRGFLKTEINTTDWQSEVERVGHRLGVEGASFETQWRMHVDLVQKYSQKLHGTTPKVNHSYSNERQQMSLPDSRKM
jgi:hypothetical protein